MTGPDSPADPDHGPRPGQSAGGGLSWSYDLDLAQVLAAAGAGQLGEADDEVAAAEEAELADAAADAGTSRDLAAVVAEELPAGPGLAAWLASADTERLTDWDIPGIAAAFRRVAAWAQAGELAAVAAMASRSAARDERVSVDPDGRPEQVTPAAASEVSLALIMSQQAAAWWTGLGVTLRWRLAATGTALAAGQVDLYRARLIAEATSPLDDDLARRVEAACLPAASGQTTGQLRAALRRAVLKADPEGAEQRRQDAERQARVSLYPDPDTGTATLAGTRLPSVHAAAAMARISALAWALKASGAGGGINLLRAQVFTGLLLGTLPLIPPPPDAPPDQPPDDDGGGDRDGGDSGGRPGGANPDASEPPDTGQGGDPARPGTPPPGGTGTRPPPEDRRHDAPLSPDPCSRADSWRDAPLAPDPGPPDNPGDDGAETDTTWFADDSLDDLDDDGPAARPPPRWPPLPGQTCRDPRCRQPAWRTDLDHTLAYEKGGRTCTCNMGGRCRTHHKIKAERGWKLTQPAPGHFQLTTPTGRTYTTAPDAYPL